MEVALSLGGARKKGVRRNKQCEQSCDGGNKQSAHVTQGREGPSLAAGMHRGGVRVREGV